MHVGCDGEVGVQIGDLGGVVTSSPDMILSRSSSETTETVELSVSGVAWHRALCLRR